MVLSHGEQGVDFVDEDHGRLRLRPSCHAHRLELRHAEQRSHHLLALAHLHSHSAPCRTHLLVRDEALMLKKVQWHVLAMALPSSVLPVPGGPNSSRPTRDGCGLRPPFGTVRRPVNRSGRCIGHMIASMMHFLA